MVKIVRSRLGLLRLDFILRLCARNGHVGVDDVVRSIAIRTVQYETGVRFIVGFGKIRSVALLPGVGVILYPNFVGSRPFNPGTAILHMVGDGGSSDGRKCFSAELNCMGRDVVVA